MKNHALITLLQAFDPNRDVIIDGSSEFIVDETGPEDEKIIVILKV